MSDDFRIVLNIVAKDGNAVDVLEKTATAVNKVDQSAKKASSSIGDVSKSATESQSAMAGLSKHMGSLEFNFKSLMPHIRTAGASLGVYFSVRAAANVVKVTDAYAELAARLKIVSGTTQELTTAQEQLFKISQENRSPIEETSKLYYRMATAMKDMGRSQAETLSVVDAVGKALKVSGASSTETAAGLQQLSQALQAGVLNGDEFRSVAENMPRVLKALSDSLGVNIATLREMSAQGKLTSQIVTEALLDQKDVIEREFTRVPITISGAWQQITNALEKYIADADEATGISKELAAAMSGFAEAIPYVMKVFTPFRLVIQGVIADMRFLTAAAKEVIDDLKMYFGDASGLFDGEIKRLMELGQGKVPISELATGKADPQNFFNGMSASAEKATAAIQKYGEIQQKVVAEAIRQKLDPSFALAIAQAESGFNPNATSNRGAQGVMQMMPSNFRKYGVTNGYDADQSIRAGVTMLVELMNQFKGDKRLAAAAYNAGPNRDSLKEGRVPAIPETQLYVKNVQKNWEDWAKQLSGSGIMSPFGDDKEIQRDADYAYKVFSEVAKRRTELNDAESAKRLALQSVELKKLQGQLDEFNNASQIKIKATVDQKSYEDQLTVINEAQKKSEEFIRQMNDVSGGSSDEAVRKAKEEVSLIDEKIKLSKEYSQSEDDITSLQQEREIAVRKLSAEEIKSSESNITLQRALQENQQKYDALRKESLTQETELQIKQEEYAQQIGKMTAEGAKSAIDSKLEQARAQVALSESERQGLLENATGLAQIQITRNNIKANLVDTLNLIELEKQSAIEKLQIDKQMLDYEEQSIRLRMAATQEREKQLQYEKELAGVHLQQAENAQAYETALSNAAKASAEAQTKSDKSLFGLDTKEVKERQLELNAFWDQTMNRMREYAALMKEISGTQKNAWADMSVTVMGYAKSVDQITQKYDDLQSQWRKTTGAAEGESDSVLAMQEAFEQGQAAAAMMAKTMLSARDNTEKGSQAYKNLTTAAENFMALVQLLNVAEGISAVIKQLKDGDPYTAAIRAAGTAMLLASMSVNTGFGGGTPSVKKDINATGTNGGVFGGKSDEISNSIADSLKLIEDHTSNNLSYSAAMLRSLQNIETSLAGVTNQVVRNIFPSAARSVGTLKTGNDVFAFGMKGFDPLADAIFSMVYNVSRKITAYGIQGLDQSLGEILTKGFKGMTFTDFETTTKAFFMTISKKTETVYEKLNKDVAKQFTLVFQGIGDALKAGGESFGMSAEETMKKIGNVKLNIGKIDLAGLSGKEIQEKLSQAFSKMTDKLAKQLMPSLGDFLQVGESYSKTFFRVAEGINRAKGELEQLGLTAINYTEITKKQGDVAAEIVRQTLRGQSILTDGTRKYVDELTGSAEDIIDAYKMLVEATQLMRAGGLNTNNLDRTMINAAGGLDAFVNAMKTFNDKFLSEGERLANDASRLSDQFINLGLVMPSSSEGFRALVTGIDTSTVAGKKLFGQVISLSDSFATLQEKIKATQDKYATILNPMGAIKLQIDTVITDFNGLIAASATQMKSTGPLTQQIKDLRNTQSGWAIAQGDWIQKRIDKQKEIDKLESTLAETIGKTPKAKKVIDSLKKQIQFAKNEMIALNVGIDDFAQAIADYDQQIKEAVAANDQALADSLSADKAKKLLQMGDVLVSTLEAFWKSLMDGVRNLQKGLAAQIATLQGPDAIAGLARSRLSDAQGAITSYIDSLSTGRARNVTTEIQLIQDAQSAVMDKYNAEMTLLQQAAQEQAAVLQENLQNQIDAINAETDAKVQAINDSTDAQVQAINDTLDATLTAKQAEHEIALKGLQDQLEAANKLKSAIKGIQDYAKSMLLGGNTTLSPEKRLQEAQAQYQALLAKANAGDADAMAKLSGASDTYLSAAKEYYGSGTQYANIFDGVKAAMDQLSAMDAPDPDSIQAHIDAMREAQAAELKSIREAAQQQIKELQGSAKDQIKAIQEAAKDQIKTLQTDVAQQIKDLSDPNKNAAMKALKEETIAELKHLQELSQKVQEEANRQALEALELARKQYDFSAKQTEYLFKIADQMGIKGITPYAAGGSAQAGLALVGEKGPELVNFERPAQVMTAEDTRSALNGDAETKQFLADIKAELKALVTTQSAANPQLVEKLTGMESRLSKMERNQRLSA